MMSVSSDAFVDALARAGFTIYRRDAHATVLERGIRAVVVPRRATLEPDALVDLRRMTGLSWRELDALLASTRSSSGSPSSNGDHAA